MHNMQLSNCCYIFNFCLANSGRCWVMKNDMLCIRVAKYLPFYCKLLWYVLWEVELYLYKEIKLRNTVSISSEPYCLLEMYLFYFSDIQPFLQELGVYINKRERLREWVSERQTDRDRDKRERETSAKVLNMFLEGGYQAGFPKSTP